MAIINGTGAANDLSGDIHGVPENDAIYGFGSSDALDGQDGNDLLLGGSGNDTLLGSEGKDTLNGGTGNDYMDGGEGIDTYLVGYNQGRDEIYSYDSSGAPVDRIVIDSSVAMTDVRLTDDGSNLFLHIGAGTTVKIDEGLGLFYYGYGVATIQMPDGTILDLTIGGLPLTGDAADNYISGTLFSDNIRGLDGNDTLIGYDGDDTINGGRGDDILAGFGGIDTYVVGYNQGYDIIYAIEGSN